MSDMTFTLPGGARVDAQIRPFTIHTDQPPGGSAPAPFALFLASIGACAAYYVQVFCERRGIPYDAIRVRQHNERGPGGYVEEVRITVELPPDFPPRYREAVLRAADQCTVKKHLEHPPRIAIAAAAPEPALAETA
jgi:ribosomal protein S12 methylthiotransferase accessory factor